MVIINVVRNITVSLLRVQTSVCHPEFEMGLFQNCEPDYTAPIYLQCEALEQLQYVTTKP